MRTGHQFETKDRKGNKHTVVIEPLNKGYSYIVDGRNTQKGGKPFYEEDLTFKFSQLRFTGVEVTYAGEVEDGKLTPKEKAPAWFYDKPVDPKVKEFVRYVLSQEGQLECERDGKYVPLTPEDVRAQLKKLE